MDMAGFEGQSLYDTAGLNPSFTFHDLAMLMHDMPERYLMEDDLHVITPAVLNGQTYYLMLNIPTSEMK
ncbi:putative two-component sensor histidine kinase [Paenibacillus agaridevorans]|uniref:Putative two-component sensor histidine kinase n=1 Tax=Paenibacillus agaridevorans TaxID=171404 RepID=A0A2R5ENZ8_9BACL|nr:hypothetical protein [Paenibacillus agaridevorans]GBG08297.1 putative two-component sensor histidine kinase [Paenibacillus agaridevorans]